MKEGGRGGEGEGKGRGREGERGAEGKGEEVVRAGKLYGLGCFLVTLDMMVCYVMRWLMASWVFGRA